MHWRGNQENPVVIWHSILAMTLADILICGSIGFAVVSFLRTYGGGRDDRANWGLLLVLFGLSMIGGYYLINLASIQILPAFVTPSRVMSVLRTLQLHGYWLVVGTGLVTLSWGLYLINREIRALRERLQDNDAVAGGAIVEFPRPDHVLIPEISAPSQNNNGQEAASVRAAKRARAG